MTGTDAHQLIEIPSTNLHISTILIQALGERFGIRLTATGTPAITLISRVVGLRSSNTAILRLGFRSRVAGSASKEPANRMPDGRAYSNTTATKDFDVSVRAEKCVGCSEGRRDSRESDVLTLRSRPSVQTAQGSSRLAQVDRLAGQSRVGELQCWCSL